MKMYQVSYYGGMEGKDFYEEYYATEEQARQSALADKWVIVILSALTRQMEMDGIEEPKSSVSLAEEKSNSQKKREKPGLKSTMLRRGETSPLRSA